MQDRRAITAYLGLGSNEGDREGHLRTALERLAGVPGIAVSRVSSFLESALVGEGPAQGTFCNAVAEIRTTLLPHALLAVLKEIEAAAGRRLPAPKNHPRPLDLDVLAFGDQRIDSRDLIVPHPRWHERDFVLAPLRELGVDTAAWPRFQVARIIHAAPAFAAQCNEWLAGGCVIGLVPTMGALHAGHQSLIERAARECDRVAVTIFVNPLQFGAGEDFGAYPRSLARDVELCREAGAAVVFAPTPAEMYGPGFCSQIAVGAAAQTMEGGVRPGHFVGVATVVAKLLALSRPHRAYFGEKDAQQLAVIRRMARDLMFPGEIVGCAIVREADGLAMSSRNVYLEPGERVASTVLFRALASARRAFAAGVRDRDALLGAARSVLAGEPRGVVDYVELRSEGDLEPLSPGPVAGGRMLVAVRFAGGARPVRLIDNLSLTEVAP